MEFLKYFFTKCIMKILSILSMRELWQHLNFYVINRANHHDGEYDFIFFL